MTRGTSLSYHVTKDLASITLFLQLGILMDNGREKKPTSCPRMRYHGKVHSSNKSIFTVVMC